MNKIQRNFKTSIAHCKARDNEEPVKQHLTYTPSDMREMIKKGYPVSPQQLDDSYFSDTDNRPTNDFSLDIWDKRSASINDAWETQQDSKHKIRKAHKEGAFEKVTEGGVS